MKQIISLSLLLFAATSVFAEQEIIKQPVLSDTQWGGVGIGTVIAIVASWSRNKSAFWAIIHAILGWFYVIYFVLTRSSRKAIS
jgi:hypothetical protein